MTFGYGDITHEVDIWKCFKDVDIRNCTELGRLVVFTKYAGSDVRVKSLHKKHLIEKLMIIDRFESTRFNEYLDAYYYINDIPIEEQFWNKMRTNLQNLFCDDEEFLELNIPSSYSEQTFLQINKILGYEKAGDCFVMADI